MAQDKQPAAQAERFDPEAARSLLKAFLDADEDVPESHPLFPVYLQYIAWEDQMEKAKLEYDGRLGADKGVPRDVARSILDVGSLSSDNDFMLVHTRQALRLFVGRGRDPEGRLSRIPSAKAVGAALREMWLLSGKDHPYADWLLILAELEVNQLMQQIERATAEARAQIDALASDGLHLSIMASIQPARVDLGFRSPYGFLISQLVLKFDYYVRVIKTLSARNLITADKERSLISERMRPMRSFFDRVLRNQNVLQVPAYGLLTREDVRKPASKDVADRVASLNEIWPGLPVEVLERRHLPHHVKPLRRDPARAASADKPSAEAGLL